MNDPKSTAQIGGHPLHPMLVPFPIAFFVGTFVSDVIVVIRWLGGELMFKSRVGVAEEIPDPQ